jgi:hypothetical protein
MKPIFNLSLDDAGPHPKCDPFPAVIALCDKLIQRWPDIKIDLFTSAAYARLNEEPYFLSQYPEWVKQAKALPRANYRFNLHSYYHRRLSVKWPNSNNNEVERTTEKETKMLVDHAVIEFKTAGLECSKVFRAPGFHLGQSAAKVLTDLGFTIAGNQRYADALKGKVPGLKYVVSTSILDPIPTGDTLLYGHTSNWCGDFLPKVYDRVVQVLESREFEFRFLEELED